MQRCNLLIPLIRQLGRTSSVHHLQPCRNLFYRKRGGLVPMIWNSLDMEKRVNEMAQHFEQMEREIDAAMKVRGFPSLPLSLNRTPMTMYESEVDGKYHMHIMLGEKFAPEDIKVKLVERVLTVEAKYDHTSENGKDRVYQEFRRQFTLPNQVNPTEVKSMFSNGVLQIEAPLPPDDSLKPKEIPIKIESK